MRTYSPGDEPIPGYRLIEQLGQGSFGTVWQAEGPGGVLVAMKVISNLNGIHAIREWQSLQNVMNLKQANLVEIYGVWLKDEEGRVLKPDEVRALIPPEVDVGGPVTETSSAPLAAVPKKAVWAGDKPKAKPAAASHQLSGATLQPEDDPPTASPAVGSTAADSTPPVDAAGSTGSAKESTAAKSSAGSGSRGKWSKVGGVPPLELVSAMTLGEGTLMSRLKQCQAQGQRGIPRPELLRYMVEAAKGLAYLNDRQMHHCDIKPENLLLVGGSVKVCDYGSALRSIYSAESRTHQGYTEQYAAPEQLSGRRVKLHASTDMYALALTYYALRTGKYPWGESATEPIAVVKYGEKFDFSALARQSRYPYEWQVIRKALKRDPQERHATALEFVEKLEGAVRREEEAARARRRRRIRNVVLAMLLLLLVGGGVAAWFKRDELAGLLDRKSSKDRFNAAVVDNDVAAAVQIANDADPLLEAADVANGLTPTLQNLGDDPQKVAAALQEVVLLKPEYREPLQQPVADLAVRHFAAANKDQIADGQYAPVLADVAGHQGLTEWDLSADVHAALVKQWLDEAKARLAKAADDRPNAAEHAQPLAALASALADDPARQSEIDGVASQQLAAWLAAAEADLSDAGRVPRARDEFSMVAAAAGGYLATRSDPEEIRAQQAAARLGELSARYRLKNEPREMLLQELAKIKVASLAASPAVESRRILLSRVLGPDEDPELVSDQFLKTELPKLRTLTPGWEQEALDDVIERATKVAEARHEAGQLANINAVLEALKNDRLTLRVVRDALAAASAAADAPAFTEALQLARQRLSPLPKKLENPADEQARSVLESWLSLLAADAPPAGQVAATVQAFEAWDAAAGDDARARAWYPPFVLGVARRPQRWPVEFLSAEIAELENAPASTSPIDRHLAALALRSQRLLVLATEPEPTSEGLALIAQDSGRLVAARDDEEEDGALVGQFLTPPVLADALWGETALAPLASSNASRPAIEPEVKAALDRLAAFLKAEPAGASASQTEAAPYLRYVADLYRVLAPPPGDTLEDVFAPPAEENRWLAAPRRHAVAVALLLELADRAGTVNLARGVDPAAQSDAFARQLPRLTRAQSWAAAGSSEQIAVAARAALALRYAAGSRDWKAIKAACDTALADRAVCQKSVGPAHYTHLLLVHAEALRELAAGGSPGDPSELVSILAEILRRDCDLYDERKGSLADADLYERVAAPALALIGGGSSGNRELPAADLAAIHGAVGTLLERDSLRRIAVDHYDFNSSPQPYAAALRDSFQRASELDDDHDRKLRWLAGEAMAIDRDAELMPRDDYSGVAKDLASIAGRMEALDRAYFAAPAIRGLAAFYSAPKVNDVADLATGEKQRAAALASLQEGLAALAAHPQAGSPWCRTWQSTIERLASHICLQQSWNATWGRPMQAKLQEAIKYAGDARRSAPDKLEEALAASTLGNAYEDMAFYLKCVPFYDRAEQEFRNAQETVKAIDPFQEFLFRRNLIRVQYRRLSHDRALNQQVRDQWKKQLPADMEQLLEETEARGIEQYLPYTEYWLADMLVTLRNDIPALERAEKLYLKIPKGASAAAEAKRYFLAGDCAMRLALLYDQAGDAAKADEAMNRARRHVAEIMPLEKQITDAGTRRDIAQLRADIAADQLGDDAAFAEYVAERKRSLAVGSLPPADGVKLEIELHLMVASSACEAAECFELRKQALDDVFRLLKGNRVLLSEREHVGYLLRATRIALERAAAYHRPPRTTAPLPARELLTLGKQAVEAANQAQKQIGEVECCAAEGEPSLAKVSGFDAVLETRGLRDLIAAHLIKPIYDGRAVYPTWKADLTWIKTQLEELKKALPRGDAQAESLRTRIDNDYLRQLGIYLAAP